MVSMQQRFKAGLGLLTTLAMPAIPAHAFDTTLPDPQRSIRKIDTSAGEPPPEIFKDLSSAEIRLLLASQKKYERLLDRTKGLVDYDSVLKEVNDLKSRSPLLLEESERLKLARGSYIIASLYAGLLAEIRNDKDFFRDSLVGQGSPLFRRLRNGAVTYAGIACENFSKLDSIAPADGVEVAIAAPESYSILASEQYYNGQFEKAALNLRHGRMCLESFTRSRLEKLEHLTRIEAALRIPGNQQPLIDQLKKEEPPILSLGALNRRIRFHTEEIAETQKQFVAFSLPFVRLCLNQRTIETSSVFDDEMRSRIGMLIDTTRPTELSSNQRDFEFLRGVYSMSKCYAQMALRAKREGDLTLAQTCANNAYFIGASAIAVHGVAYAKFTLYTDPTKDSSVLKLKKQLRDMRPMMGKGKVISYSGIIERSEGLERTVALGLLYPITVRANSEVSEALSEAQRRKRRQQKQTIIRAFANGSHLTMQLTVQ